MVSGQWSEKEEPQIDADGRRFGTGSRVQGLGLGQANYNTLSHGHDYMAMPPIDPKLRLAVAPVILNDE